MALVAFRYPLVQALSRGILRYGQLQARYGDLRARAGEKAIKSPTSRAKWGQLMSTDVPLWSQPVGQCCHGSDFRRTCPDGRRRAVAIVVGSARSGCGRSSYPTPSGGVGSSPR